MNNNKDDNFENEQDKQGFETLMFSKIEQYEQKEEIRNQENKKKIEEGKQRAKERRESSKTLKSQLEGFLLPIKKGFKKVRNSIRRFFRAVFHPKTTAQLALAVTFFVLLAAVGVVIFANTRVSELVNSLTGNSALESTGEAQLLDSFGTFELTSEDPLTIRLDGLLISEDGTNYATLTVDGATSSFIEDDYIGPYKIDKISAGGVTLEGEGVEVVLNFTHNEFKPQEEGQ